MVENAPFRPGLSAVEGKPVQIAFDGGRLTSDGGVLVLAEIERRLGIAERLARCVADPRAPERVRHGLAEMIRYRALLFAAGHQDANDCDALRADPAFKMAVGRLPESGAALCSQPTMCRLHCVVEASKPSSCSPAALGRTLVKTVALGWAWFEMIKAGATMKAIANREGVSQRRIADLVDLAFLAPDLLRSTVEGRQPSTLTADRLIQGPISGPGSRHSETSLLLAKSPCYRSTGSLFARKGSLLKPSGKTADKPLNPWIDSGRSSSESQKAIRNRC